MPSRSVSRTELVAAEHVVHVRQDLAEGETGLVLIEFALENMRDDISNGKRLLSACVGDSATTLLVVLDQFGDACMQTVERQPMSRQYQHVLRHRVAQP